MIFSEHVNFGRQYAEHTLSSVPDLHYTPLAVCQSCLYPYTCIHMYYNMAYNGNGCYASLSISLNRPNQLQSVLKTVAFPMTWILDFGHMHNYSYYIRDELHW